MSAARSLALVPPSGEARVAPETVVLGLPIIRRTVLSASRAGFDRILVEGATPAIRAALEATPAELDAAAPAGRGEAALESERFDGRPQVAARRHGRGGRWG